MGQRGVGREALFVLVVYGALLLGTLLAVLETLLG